jgi:hypothetical protein
MNMWSDFERVGSAILRDYKDLDVDMEYNEESLDHGILRCSNESTQKKRLSCYYELALSCHASYIEMSNPNSNINYSVDVRHLKFMEAEKAYSKVNTILL